MLHDDSPWLTNRLQLFVQSGEVAAPPQKTQWQCWEEFGRTPKEGPLGTVSYESEPHAFKPGSEGHQTAGHSEDDEGRGFVPRRC